MNIRCNLTLNLLTTTIVAPPSNASKWQMGFNSAFKGLISHSTSYIVGRDSSVGIATRYGLDGPGDRIPVGARFFRPRPDRPWGPPSLLYNGYRVFYGSKAAGVWRWPSTSSSAKVKERVKLYLYSPYGPSWPILRWTFSLLYLLHVSSINLLKPTGRYMYHQFNP